MGHRSAIRRFFLTSRFSSHLPRNEVSTMLLALVLSVFYDSKTTPVVFAARRNCSSSVASGRPCRRARSR